MIATLKSLSVEQQRGLIKRLSELQSVRQFDIAGEPQAATLVHSLTDLEQSFQRILDDILPRLRDDTLSAEGLEDVLREIGEELRHVLYHIRDPKYFDYLIED